MDSGMASGSRGLKFELPDETIRKLLEPGPHNIGNPLDHLSDRGIPFLLHRGNCRTDLPPGWVPGHSGGCAGNRCLPQFGDFLLQLVALQLSLIERLTPLCLLARGARPTPHADWGCGATLPGECPD